MHRFESVQHLARPTDGRHDYFNPNPLSVPNTYPNQGFGGMHSPPHQGAMSGKGSSSNPRMPGLIALGSSSMEGGNANCPSSMYNNYRHNMPYHQGVGSGMMEGMGYLPQKRNPQMMASGQYGAMGVGASPEGYGSGGGGSRFHPYQPQMQHQAPQPPPQRSGFLEQLLKNRGSNHQPYGKPSMGMPPPSTLNSYPGGHQGFRGGNGQPGWNNYYQGMTYGPGGAVGGRTGGYIPPHHQPPQWGRGNFGGGAFQPYVPNFNNGANFNNYQNYQNNYSNLHQSSPFNHHRHQQQQQLPVIKNEPEEGEPSAQEQADADIRKSETRFRKNHERMHSILNETMANCEPIQVPLSRVETLRRHVKLLNDDVSKHKEDTAQVKDHCAKRLQEFKDSTAKFHSDYKKLSKPMESKEYDCLVDKYYNEFKDKLKKNQSIGSISADGTVGGEAVVDESIGLDDYVFMKQELNPPNKISVEGVPSSGDSNNNQGEYYENPLFIDIPQENQPRFEENAYTTPHLSQSADLCYSGGHGQQHQPQQQMADCMYYGGGSNHGDLLMTTQQQHIPTQPMRWDQNATSNSVNHFGHMQTQRQPYTVGEEGFPAHQHSHPQAVSMLRHLRQTRQTRPSEELREFVKGLVIAQQQGKLRNDLLAHTRLHHQQMPQLQQEGLPIEQHHPAQDVPDGQGHVQQRRLMSGGGIVEVKYSPPHSGVSQPPLYDDAATRDWINSLTTTVADDNSCGGGENVEGVGGIQQEEMGESGIENDDYNNNMDNPILGEGIGESPLSNSGSQGSGSLLIGKNSKLAEILESPCLNDNNHEEFESELRQLEDALNGNSEDINKNEADNCVRGDEGCSEVDEDDLIEGQENND